MLSKISMSHNIRYKKVTYPSKSINKIKYNWIFYKKNNNIKLKYNLFYR